MNKEVKDVIQHYPMGVENGLVISWEDNLPEGWEWIGKEMMVSDNKEQGKEKRFVALKCSYKGVAYPYLALQEFSERWYKYAEEINQEKDKN